MAIDGTDNGNLGQEFVKFESKPGKVRSEFSTRLFSGFSGFLKVFPTIWDLGCMCFFSDSEEM
jgi:hypothetical protein